MARGPRGNTTVPGPCLLRPILSGLTAGPASCSGGQPRVCTEPGRNPGCLADRRLSPPSELPQVGSRCPGAVPPAAAPLTAAPGCGKPQGPTLTLPSGVPTLLPECPLCPAPDSLGWVISDWPAGVSLDAPPQEASGPLPAPVWPPRLLGYPAGALIRVLPRFPSDPAGPHRPAPTRCSAKQILSERRRRCPSHVSTPKDGFRG